MIKHNLRRAASVSIVLLTLLLVSAQLGRAAENALKPPTVDYSGDMITEASGTTRTSKVFHSGDKTRTEMQSPGHSSVSIMDRSKMEAINLDPAKKTYIKMDLSKLGVAQEPSAMNDFKTTLQGKETINGVETSKYLYEGTTNGADIKGAVWVTKDNIPVRNEGTVVTGGNSISVASHLDNLKVEKQDSTLFEVPAGYTAREMPGPRGRP